MIQQKYKRIVYKTKYTSKCFVHPSHGLNYILSYNL